jgi:hypothetical protein
VREKKILRCLVVHHLASCEGSLFIRASMQSSSLLKGYDFFCCIVTATVARLIFDYLGCGFSEEAQVMQSSSQGDSLIRVVFGWSIQDVLNRDLYKDKVLLPSFFQVAHFLFFVSLINDMWFLRFFFFLW